MFHFLQYKMTWLISDLKIIVCTMNKYVDNMTKQSAHEKKNLVSNIINTTWDLFHFGGWHFSFHLIVNIKNIKNYFSYFFQWAKFTPWKAILASNTKLPIYIVHVWSTKRRCYCVFAIFKREIGNVSIGCQMLYTIVIIRVVSPSDSREARCSLSPLKFGPTCGVTDLKKNLVCEMGGLKYFFF